MCSGPPLPLPPDLPLSQLLQVLQSELNPGAWFRSTRGLRLHLAGLKRSDSGLLISADLGFLLRHCTTVAVWEGTRAVPLGSEVLIGWRALRVVTATPYLPCPHRLQQLFPESEIDSSGFQVPTRSCPPEAVLADCLTHRIPVAETHIIYRAPARLSSR